MRAGARSWYADFHLVVDDAFAPVFFALSGVEHLTFLFTGEHSGLVIYGGMLSPQMQAHRCRRSRVSNLPRRRNCRVCRIFRLSQRRGFSAPQ